MKKRFTFVIALAIVCTFIFGCKKDKEEPIDILTSKTWKWATVDKNPSTNPKGKIVYREPWGCELDDRFSFYANGTYEVKNPDSKCMSQADGFKNNKFNINLNEFYLGSSSVGTIAEISKNQLKFYFKLNTVDVPDPAAPDYVVMILE
ncbi:MAG: hypothetical protein EOO98_07995 [Pedobacter sp.]|nr:MAG: hypothetical protein EOO98_07995 [Pedobacter sp.]